jgi:hypothetical protein
MREMTLEEYVGQLPKEHRAQKEYAALRTENADLKKALRYERDEADWIFNEGKKLKAEIERKDEAILNALVIDAKDGYSMHPRSVEILMNARGQALQGREE